MKYINKIVLIVMLLLSILASAQISEIPFNPVSEQFVPKIKWDENRLMISHPAGIFYRDYSTGELPKDWGRENHKWELYGFEGYGVDRFVINGDKILGVTENRYPGGHLFVRSQDRGKTFEEFTPKEITDLVDEGYFNVNPAFLVQNPNNKNELLLGCICIFRSEDFGETWEQVPYYIAFNTAKYHPHDSDLVILGWHSWLEYYPNGNFLISQDGGKTWDEINYTGSEFGYAERILFHPTNESLILLGADPIIKSEDKGQTWKTIKEFSQDSEEFEVHKFEFDARGSNRLYGLARIYSSGKGFQYQKKLYYSDDFGATWAELCEIGLAEDDYVADFVQHGSKIYTYSKNYKVHEIDLELLESAIEEVSADASDVAVSIANGTLQVVSQSQISTIEVFNIGGVKMQSAESSDNVDISDLAKGTYVARIVTSVGKTICCKFNY